MTRDGEVGVKEGEDCPAIRVHDFKRLVTEYITVKGERNVF